MTMFRVGPAGIPASLKTDMNAVLNKKFGTTGQNYPPAGWPDDVNLLGPLPVKTASGAVAAFSDGADDVPLKSLSCQIVPVQSGSGDPSPSNVRPIVGTSSVTVYHTGKNLIDNSADAWENGTINYLGNNASGSGIRTKGYFAVKGGDTFALSGVVAPSDNSDFCVFFYDKNNVFISYQGYRAEFTIPENARYFRIRNISIEDISNMQIEYGSTATAYEAYKSKTPITIQLGQTVYGGTLAEDGTLTLTHGFSTFDGSEDEDWRTGQSGGIYRYRIICLDASYPASGRKSLICNIGAFSTGNTENTVFISNYNNQAGVYYIPPQTVQTVEDFKTWLSSNNMQICYELATPIVITGLDEISLSTYLGDNSIWCDSGDSECEYYADIYLALQAVSGSRGLMMSSLRSAEPMIGEESIPEEINELEEPEITEQEGDNDAR